MSSTGKKTKKRWSGKRPRRVEAMNERRPAPGEFGWQVPAEEALEHFHVALETIRQFLEREELVAALQAQLVDESESEGEHVDWVLAFAAKLPVDAAELYSVLSNGLAAFACVDCKRLFQERAVCEDCVPLGGGEVERFKPPRLKLSTAAGVRRLVALRTSLRNQLK